VPLLDALSDLQRQRLLASARLRRFARNEVLFHEGDPADSLHVITRGRIAVRVSSELGARVTVDVLSRDDIRAKFWKDMQKAVGFAQEIIQLGT